VLAPQRQSPSALNNRAWPLNAYTTGPPTHARALYLSLGALNWPGTRARLVWHREAPGPQPPSLVLQGCPEAEAAVAGLCHHELPSSPASEVSQGSRAAPGAACGGPTSSGQACRGAHCSSPQGHF